jgi:hypothetical protein
VPARVPSADRGACAGRAQRRFARNTKTAPQNGSSPNISCTASARPSMPLRKSTGPRRHEDLHRPALAEHHDRRRPRRPDRPRQLPSSAPQPARITTSPTTISSSGRATAPTALRRGALDHQLREHRQAATLSGTPAAPSAASCASRRPASASCRAARDIRHRTPGTRLSAAIRARSAFVRRRRPVGPSITSSRETHRPSSRPNGRPLCRLFQIQHLQRSCARRIAAGDRVLAADRSCTPPRPPAHTGSRVPAPIAFSRTCQRSRPDRDVALRGAPPRVRGRRSDLPAHGPVGGAAARHRPAGRGTAAKGDLIAAA